MLEVKPEHLTLDRAHLQQANFQQASLIDLYGSECSKQQSKVDRIKNKLEYRSSQLKIEIRKNADVAKIKMTQDQVDCALTVEPEIVQLKEELLDAEEYLGQLKVAVEALRHKRDSINNEYKLAISKADAILNGDVDSDIKFREQTAAVEKATQASMNK